MTLHQEFDRLSGTLYVDGAYLKSRPERISVIDPATEERIAEIANAAETEVENVIDIANIARKRWLSIDPARAPRCSMKWLLASVATRRSTATL